METVAHVYGLSRIIANSVRKEPTTVGKDEATLSFSEMRKRTLENLKETSDALKASSDKDLNDYNMVFKRDTTSTTFPFWNELNGPIADVLWHVGQLITFRRSSGNPYNSNANVLTGKVKPGVANND